MNGITSLGFMQGRLSPLVDNKIQCFPWNDWKEEFSIASKNGFSCMEWTLDQKDLYLSPLMTKEGREDIRKLQKDFSIQINSLTGDCFMQAPFYKKTKKEKLSLVKDLKNILISCAELDIQYIVFPLVDGGCLETNQQEKDLLSVLLEFSDFLFENNQCIVFESDKGPKKLKEFISQFPKKIFGINYDTGNSAALGFDPREEFDAYGESIYNIHIKDRLIKGKTVPLGKGNTDFLTILKKAQEINYQGQFILQTARAEDDDHLGALKKYRNFVNTVWEKVWT